MRFTINQLRAMSPDYLAAPRGSTLVDELQVVRDAERSAVATLTRLSNLSGDGKSRIFRQQADVDDDERELAVVSPLAEILDRAANAIDRFGLPDSGGSGIVRTGSSQFRAGQILTPEQRMSGYLQARGLVNDDGHHLSTGKYFGGLLTGQRDGAEAERRAMVVGTAPLADVGLPWAIVCCDHRPSAQCERVLQAGARIVPMESSTLKIARAPGDPTAAWHSGMAAIAASDMTLDAITLTARTLASRVIISRELLEDADGIDEVVENVFAQQFSLTLDLARALRHPPCHTERRADSIHRNGRATDSLVGLTPLRRL